MSNLYTFNKKGFPARFFHWVWGVWPHQKFPTMCPYFWSFVGTLLISPILIPIVGLIKLITGVPESKLGTWIEQAGEACDDYKRKRIIAKRERLKVREDSLIDQAINAFVQYLKYPSLQTAMAFQRANRLPKEGLDCWDVKGQYADKIAELNKDILDRDTLDTYQSKYFELYDTIRSNAEERARKAYKEKQKAKEARKELAETVASNPVIKLIVSFFIGIGILLAGAVAVVGISGLLYVIYLGLGWWFSRYALETALTVVGLIGLGGVIWCIARIIRCWGDQIRDSLGKFFNAIGNGILFVLTPVGHAFVFVGSRMGWVGTVLSAIGSAFEIAFNMVIATYKKYCPMITWTDEE